MIIIIEDLILNIMLVIFSILFLINTITNIIYIVVKRKHEKLFKEKKAKCEKCNKILSEWFKNDEGFMVCYYCKITSVWKCHKDYQNVRKGIKKL